MKIFKLLLILLFLSSCSEPEQSKIVGSDLIEFEAYVAHLLGYQAPDRYRELLELIIDVGAFGRELYEKKLSGEELRLHTNEMQKYTSKIIEVIVLMYQEHMTKVAVIEGYNIFCDEVDLPERASPELELVSIKGLFDEILSPLDLRFVSDSFEQDLNRLDPKRIESHYYKHLNIVIRDLEQGKFEPNCRFLSVVKDQLDIKFDQRDKSPE